METCYEKFKDVEKFNNSKPITNYFIFTKYFYKGLLVLVWVSLRQHKVNLSKNQKTTLELTQVFPIKETSLGSSHLSEDTTVTEKRKLPFFRKEIFTEVQEIVKSTTTPLYYFVSGIKHFKVDDKLSMFEEAEVRSYLRQGKQYVLDLKRLKTKLKRKKYFKPKLNSRKTKNETESELNFLISRLKNQLSHQYEEEYEEKQKSI